MLRPLDRHRRDPTLFQFTIRRLHDFVDPDHLLIRIDERFDFANLVATLEDHYCPDNRRPAGLGGKRCPGSRGHRCIG